MLVQTWQIDVDAFENYAPIYNIEIFNSFDIKNKPNKSFNELKGFKFVITFVLKLKKKEMKQSTVPFTRTQIWIICLNQSIVEL